jgi:hypothetical protein
VQRCRDITTEVASASTRKAAGGARSMGDGQVVGVEAGADFSGRTSRSLGVIPETDTMGGRGADPVAGRVRAFAHAGEQDLTVTGSGIGDPSCPGHSLSMSGAKARRRTESTASAVLGILYA